MEKRLYQDILNIEAQIYGGAWVDGKISEGNFDLALRIIYDSIHPIPHEDNYSEVYVAYNNLSNNNITKEGFIEKLEEVKWVSKNVGQEVSEYEFTEMLLTYIGMIEQNIIFCKNNPTEITYNMTKQEYAYFEILLWMDSLHDYWFGSKEQTTTPYGKFGEYSDENNGLTFIKLFLNKVPNKELRKALKDINQRISKSPTEPTEPIWQNDGNSLPERTYNMGLLIQHILKL